MGLVVHIIVDDRTEEAARLLVQVKGVTKVDMTHHNGTTRRWGRRRRHDDHDRSHGRRGEL